MKRLALTLLIALAATPALAGQPVALRPDTAASGPITLGDLFEGAGAAAKIVVGPAVQNGSNVVLDAGSVQRAARNAGLDWDNAKGIRRIIVHAGAAVPTAAPASAQAGKPSVKVDVLTYTRNLAAGDIVEADDIEWGEVSDFAAPKDAPKDPDAVIGKSAKKPVRAGAAVAAKDLAMPVVIKRDDAVKVIYSAGGVSLTMEGKAQGSAAIGESFDVLNKASKKTIQAVAVGPGRAVVGPDADRIRDQSSPSTLALR